MKSTTTHLTPTFTANDHKSTIMENVISNQNHQTEELRRYLLRVLVGVRHVEISICGLYSYALYVRVLGNNEAEDIYERIKENSWIPVLSESDEAEAKKNLEEQIALLQKHMAKIDYKIRLYAKAVELGSLEKARIDKGLQKEQQKIYGADSFSTSEDAKQTTR